MPKNSRLTYRDAGVNIEKADNLLDSIRPLIKSTRTEGVIEDIGGFGGLFSPEFSQYRDPVLIAATDGVGTKLKLAFAMSRYNTIGIDLVAMNVNDILSCGARPLFFLDYFSTGKLDKNTAISVIQGIVDGCREAGCALLGGETAEMPGFYHEGEFDLAGFAVGIAERARIMKKEMVEPSDELIGCASNGLHSNGFSLARKVLLEHHSLSLDEQPEGLSQVLGEELLKPTRIYCRSISPLLEGNLVRNIAHITGGGIPGNLSRVLPEGTRAVIEKGSWEVPPVFILIQRLGDIESAEMYRTFNMGIGMILVVKSQGSEEVLRELNKSGIKAVCIGRVESSSLEEEDKVIFV